MCIRISFCNFSTIRDGGSTYEYPIIRADIFLIFLISSIRRKPNETKLDFDNVKWQLQAIRSNQYPKHPKIERGDPPIEIHKKYQKLLDGVEIRKVYGRTLDSRHKLYFGPVVKAMFAFHVFVSFSVIDMIKKHITKDKQQKQRYLIDGTFEVVPKKFNQLFIVTIEYKNDVRSSLISVLSNLF